MKRIVMAWSLLLPLALAAGCATQKAPAEAALKAAETAWAAASAEAQRYMPDQAKGIAATIESAKAAMGKGDYAAALKDLTDLPTRIADLQKAIADKKAQWTATWTSMDNTLGAALTSVQAKVDELLKARRLPAGLDKATVEGAGTALSAAKQVFGDAKSAFERGDFEQALAKANEAKTEVGKIFSSLKMELPTGF